MPEDESGYGHKTDDQLPPSTTNLPNSKYLTKAGFNVRPLKPHKKKIGIFTKIACRIHYFS